MSQDIKTTLLKDLIFTPEILRQILEAQTGYNVITDDIGYEAEYTNWIEETMCKIMNMKTGKTK